MAQQQPSPSHIFAEQSEVMWCVLTLIVTPTILSVL